MIDILMLTIWDHANTAYRTAKALQYAGYKVLAFKGLPHPFLYPEQLPIHPVLSECANTNYFWYSSEQLQAIMEDAHCIYCMHSTFFETGDFDKPIVLHHGGERYRVNHEVYNSTVGARAAKTVVQMPDLLGKGAINEVYIPFSVDTEQLSPWECNRTRKRDKIVVGHFPSSSGYRGTTEIKAALHDIPGIEVRIDDQVPWSQQIQRMADCDIIIENLFEKSSNGHPWGEFGNTAFEAAALGKVVITNSHRIDVYKAKFGDPELIIANNVEEMRTQVRCCVGLGDNWVYDKGQRTRIWVNGKHSLERTGMRLRQEVFEDVLNGT